MTTITSLEQVHESRLTWPPNKPRAAQRVKSPFRSEADKASREIDREMERWRVRQYIISRNNQRIFAGDPGAAVWWIDPRKKELRVLAADKYVKLADNLHAIYLTLDAMRALERWGAYTMEQAAEGAKLALPPPDRPPDWWAVLGVEKHWPLVAIEAVYRDAAKKAHPDAGGNPERFKALSEAIEAARKELGG